jgi:transposase
MEHEMSKKYIIDLNEEEREMLLEVIKKGRVAGYKRQHAQILLKADINGAGGGWTDAQIHEAFEVSIRTIERVRKCLVEQGMEAALSRAKAEKVRSCRLDGEDEAHLVALCCSEPPAGRNSWTLRLLAAKMVELNYVESVSHETVRRVLKKMS